MMQSSEQRHHGNLPDALNAWGTGVFCSKARWVSAAHTPAALATQPSGANVPDLLASVIQIEFPVMTAVDTALTRARNVLQALKGDTAFRQANRQALGYIAVSGEDDLPLRPVNVPGAPLSIHNERPGDLAQAILDFVQGTG